MENSEAEPQKKTEKEVDPFATPKPGNPPIVTEADALAEIFGETLFDASPVEFARLAKVFRSSLGPRDVTEELHVNIILLGICQLRQVVQATKADPNGPDPKLFKLTSDTMKLITHGYERIAEFRKRTDQHLDEWQLTEQLKFKRALEEAAKDCVTPDPNWREVLNCNVPDDVGGQKWPVVSGTAIKAYDVMMALLEKVPMERVFMEWYEVTAADIRAIRGCYEETGCIIEKVEPYVHYRHVPMYDLTACVYGRGLRPDEVRIKGPWKYNGKPLTTAEMIHHGLRLSDMLYRELAPADWVDPPEEATPTDPPPMLQLEGPKDPAPPEVEGAPSVDGGPSQPAQIQADATVEALDEPGENTHEDQNTDKPRG